MLVLSLVTPLAHVILAGTIYQLIHFKISIFFSVCYPPVPFWLLQSVVSEDHPGRHAARKDGGQQSLALLHDQSH